MRKEHLEAIGDRRSAIGDRPSAIGWPREDD
jgi:hypothetical protein